MVQAQFTFTTNTDGSLNISQYTGANAVVVIPSIADGYPVVSIGEQAFDDCTNLTNVTIPSSVTNIGEYAFQDCSNLTSAYFQGNFPSADTNVFSGDPVTVYYLAGTTNWGTTFGSAPTVEETAATQFDYSTNDDSITITDYTSTNDAVVIPDLINGYAVVSIGNDAFADCTNLASITIPNSVTNIGRAAFYDCNNMTSVIIPFSVINIANFAFSYCTNMTNIIIPDSVTSIGQGSFEYCSSLVSVAVPNGVTNFGRAAFYHCNNLTSVSISNGITSIGGGAFDSCTSLASVAIPASITNFDGVAFYECESLTNISVDAANPAYSSLNGVLFDKGQDTLIEYPAGLTNSTYAIPASVTSIGALAFGGCVSLVSASIPKSVTGIGEGAFENCFDLASVTIAASATNIGDYAFESCSNLTSVYFQGNAPPDDGSVFVGFPSNDPVTVYYLPGTTGWGTTFGSAPTVLWNPQATVFTTAGGQFGFNITGPTNAIIVVEACTNLFNPAWVPVSTNTLLGSGTSSFSDPQWTNYPIRFYRLSSP